MELSKLNLITNLRLPSLIVGWLLYSSSFLFADRVTVNGIEQVASGGISVETDPIYTNGILNYYTKGESDGRYATGTPLYVYGETDTLQRVVERGNFSSRDILPLTPTNSLGSFAYPWQDVYISTNSIYLGTSTKLFMTNNHLSVRQDSYIPVVTNGSFDANINGWLGGGTIIFWESAALGAKVIPSNIIGGMTGQEGTGADYPNASDVFKISMRYAFTNFYSGAIIQFTFDNGTTFHDVALSSSTGIITYINTFAVSGTRFEMQYDTTGTTNEDLNLFIQDISVERQTTNSTSELSTSGGVFQVTSANGMSINGVTQPILRTATSNFSWAAIAAGERVTQTVTIAGCKVGDGVSVTPATIHPPALRWSAQIFSTNTVSLFVRNDDLLATSTPSNGNWRVEVRSY